MPSAPLINSPPGRPPDESSSFEGREYGAFLEAVEFNGTLEERVRSFIEFGAPVALLRQGVRTSDRVRRYGTHRRDVLVEVLVGGVAKQNLAGAVRPLVVRNPRATADKAG